MARSFVSPDRFATAGSSVTSYPVTMAAWVRITTAGRTQAFMSIGAGGASDPQRFEMRFPTTDIAQARSVDSALGTNAASAAAATPANTWTHVAGVFVSDSSRSVYVDGTGSTNTITRTVDPSAFAYQTIGCNVSSGPAYGNFFEGHIAEAAWWAAELTAAEIAVLAAGYSPLFVRPAALRSYAPLFGRNGASGDEEDWVGGLTFAQSSLPGVVDHPRIIYPSCRVVVQAVAAAATGFKPAWARRNSRVIGGGV